MKKIFILFVVISFSCMVSAQNKKVYKPIQKTNYSIINNRIKKNTTTYTPVVKEKQVAVVTTVKKGDAPPKSYITYKKKRLVYWKTRTKTRYSPIIK